MEWMAFGTMMFLIGFLVGVKWIISWERDSL